MYLHFLIQISSPFSGVIYVTLLSSFFKANQVCLVFLISFFFSWLTPNQPLFVFCYNPLQYLLPFTYLYFWPQLPHPCHMILSKQKCCLLWNGVSKESQKLTSVRQIKRGFSPTNSMTLIHVGLALRYVKLLLSSWKIYMSNLMARHTNI